MRTNAGSDFQAVVMGGDLNGEVGTASATTATQLSTTSAVVHSTNDLVNHRVLATTPSPPVEGTIVANTSGTNTILTVDQWTVPGTTSVATTPPNTTAYCILSGGTPARVIALSTNTAAPAATDTVLTGELNNSGGGLNRAKATYAHTIGTNSYTLTNTWTANASDGTSNSVQKIGVFNSVKAATGTLVFETAVPAPPTLVSGDTLQVIETVSF